MLLMLVMTHVAFLFVILFLCTIPKTKHSLKAAGGGGGGGDGGGGVNFNYES